MADSAYLREEVGSVLAEGIAKTVAARPEDPVEYLGLWLRHHLEEKENAAQERLVQEEMQRQRAEWVKGRATKERAACDVIQAGWKHHREQEEKENQREATLRQKIADFTVEEIEADPEKYEPELTVDDLLDKEAKPAEQDAELDMLRAERNFIRWNAYVRKLSKESVASIKGRQKVSDDVVKVIRCVFYLVGKLPARTAGGERADAVPSRLVSWSQIQANIKPFPFLTAVQELDPCVKRGEANPPTKRRVNRVRRVLDGAKFSEESIKADPREGGGGTAVWILWQWLRAAVDWRTQRDNVFKAKKAEGKGPFGEAPAGKAAGDFTGGLATLDGWEEDPGDEDEGEEKDADEEEQKAIEEAERRALAEEEGAGEEGEGGDE